MNSPNMIIDQDTIDYIILTLGVYVGKDFRETHSNWSFFINDKKYPVFPSNYVDDADRIDTYLQDVFEGKTLNEVYNIMTYSILGHKIRSSIMSHLSLLISNAKMSQEIVEIKNSVKDLNDKFAILMDVLELNKPK